MDPQMYIEQLQLRYSGTWLMGQDGVAYEVEGIEWDGTDDDGEALFSCRYMRPSQSETSIRPRYSHKTMREADLDFKNIWGTNSVVWVPAIKGVVVWSRRPARQIKRGVCDRTACLDVVASPLFPTMGQVMQAMHRPALFSYEDAIKAMKEDVSITSMPIGRHAWLSNTGQVFYGTRCLGEYDKARQHKLWSIINKEAA